MARMLPPPLSAAASARRERRRRVRRWTAGLVLGGLVIGVAMELAGGEPSWRGVIDVILGWNAVAVFVALSLLPVVGFSVAVTYLVAGAKFGPWMGGVVIAAATAVHLLASYGIAKSVLRGPLQRWLTRRGHHLPHVPKGEDAAVAALAALVPGPPYFARNYLLALADVPLRIYFWVCWPIYVVRSYVVILLGDLGAKPDRRALLVLGTVYAVKLAVCFCLLWRIRRRLQRRARLGGLAATSGTPTPN